MTSVDSAVDNSTSVTPADGFIMPTLYKPLHNQKTTAALTTTQAKPHAPLLTSPEECAAAACMFFSTLTTDQSFERMDTHGVVDVRPSPRFMRGHVAGSTSIPWGTNGEIFWSRIHELPPRGVPIAVVSDSGDQVHAVSDFLNQTRVMPIVFCMVLSDGVVQALTDLNLWTSLEKQPRLPATDCSHNRDYPRISFSLNLGRRLWTASHCLRTLAPLVERETIGHSTRAALDIGCAQGRECVWLGMRDSWDVIVGSDVVQAKLDRYEDLSQRYSTRATMVALLANVKRAEDDEKVLACAPSGFSLVHVSRFLYRPMFERVRDALVRSGGFLVWHTFVEGCEAFGRPKRKRDILKRGELAAFFGGSGWKVWMDEVRSLEDGRPVSWFCAQKMT